MVAVDERTNVTRAHEARQAEPSIAELVNRASQQVSTLVRDELALARAEMTAKGKQAGMGGGLVGGAGLLALYGLGLLITLAVVALDLVWPLWASVLVVMVWVFGLAAILGLLGRRQLRRAVPPVPGTTAASVAEDVRVVKAAVREGRA